MVWICGDTHGMQTAESLKAKAPELTEEDIVIILGDFGCIWSYDFEPDWGLDQENLSWFARQKFTTLFIDGNHENFPMLYSYPVVEMYGGKCHKINDKLYHLMRGEFFTIEGKGILVMGGASSHDKELRIDRISWWEEELPNSAEMENLVKNIGEHYEEIDYILTHCIPQRFVPYIVEGATPADRLTGYFDYMYGLVGFEHWYAGHMHCNVDMAHDFTILYDKIIPLGGNVNAQI